MDHLAQQTGSGHTNYCYHCVGRRKGKESDPPNASANESADSRSVSQRLSTDAFADTLISWDCLALPIIESMNVRLQASTSHVVPQSNYGDDTSSG